jgi:multidrug efflux pump subunit AcrA (membrane-fusion protein)
VKPLPVICTLVLLSACGSSANEQVEVLRIETGRFDIALLASGELRAAESTPVTPPPGSRIPRVISWLIPDNSIVKKGDVVMRFDVSDAERGALETGIELTKVDLNVLTREFELDRLLAELGGQLDIIDIERIMVEQFAVEDTLAYSRMEIIDAMRDRELLDYRAGHLEGKKDSYRDRQSAEIEVLDAQRATQKSENVQHQALLDHSEVRAPHDGFIVYERGWWRPPVEVGITAWPNTKIASIPNLDKMEAVLLVHETDAVGLAVGQAVDLTIDAYPDQPLSGTVSGISPTAAPIERNNPVKYFNATVAIDQADPEWITPGAKVRAEIHISRIDEAIAVPNQVLFQGGEGDWLFVLEGGDLKKRSVTLGTRGAYRSQVTAGLEPGDEIALHPPEQEP